MCHLCKALYGLKQAPRAWYIELQPFLMAIGFVNSHSSTSLFVYNTNDLFLYLLVYVDDLILIGNDLGFINKFVCHLPYNSPLRTLAHCLSSLELRWSHLNMVSFFLNRSTLLSSSLGPTWWMLKKSKHLSHQHIISHCLTTPHWLILLNIDKLFGSLQYLSLTHLNITFVVNKLC